MRYGETICRRTFTGKPIDSASRTEKIKITHRLGFEDIQLRFRHFLFSQTFFKKKLQIKLDINNQPLQDFEMNIEIIEGSD